MHSKPATSLLSIRELSSFLRLLLQTFYKVCFDCFFKRFFKVCFDCFFKLFYEVCCNLKILVSTNFMGKKIWMQDVRNIKLHLIKCFIIPWNHYESLCDFINLTHVRFY